MKNRIACLLGMLALCLSAGTAHAQLYAGAAKVSITPDPKTLPYQLGGYFAPTRLENKARGIHDTCYARALVLSDGKVKCAIVSLDLCFMPTNVKTAVMAHLTQTGLSASTVFIASTHTHSAPDPLALHSRNSGAGGKLPKFDPKLLDWFAKRIAQAITEANGAMRPAEAGSGQADKLGLNRNRRGEKLTDDQMIVLKLVGADGKPLAEVVNYAAHPTYFDDKNLDVSGDWAGAMERKIEAKYAGSVALFVNGAEGDASPNGADQGTAAQRIDVYSDKMLRNVAAICEAVSVSPSIRLTAWNQEVVLPERKPHIFFILAAAQAGASTGQAKELVNQLMPDRTVLSFVGVGDLLLMGFPGEPTATIGLQAKQIARDAGAKLPAVCALTNGWLGYLVSAQQYKDGKYETSMSFYGDQIGQCMLDGLVAGLKNLPAR